MFDLSPLHYEPTSFFTLISLKLIVRATVIALKLQISFCQDSW